MERKNWRSAWVLALLSVLLQTEATNAANILALFPFASRSHNNVFSTITKALSEKGHHFTVVTSHPIESPPPNYHQIDVYHLVGHHFNVFNITKRMGFFYMNSHFKKIIVDACRVTRNKEEVQNLAKPKDRIKFDLILLSGMFSECLYPFAHVYNAPIVLLSPAGLMPFTYSAVGNVMLPSYFAHPITSYNDRMNFKERIMSTLSTVGISILYKFYIQRAMEYEMRLAFGEDTPSISELEEHVSLAVVNHHFSLNQPRQTVPCLIEAGGLHVKPPKELPKHLKIFLDEAGKDGVIYFSLGSILKSSGFLNETRDELIAAFSRVKQRVLWKWEGENPIPGQPKNVRLEKWLPQQDVLAHPNVKLFITHGGLLSFQEAVSRGVPIIGIPYYGDQDLNMRMVLDLQVGVKLDGENLTANSILNAINQVLDNPMYAMNMKRMQSVVTDQKDHPLERAVYWIEYVIRHKGAKHLKPAAFYLQWYQLYMLDVLLVLVVIPLIVISALGYVFFKVIKRKCRKSSTSIKKTQ